MGFKVKVKSNELWAKYTFKEIYPHYVSKVERKGRTKTELSQVIEWLTGYNEKTVSKLCAEEVTLETFFERATIHPNAHLITGSICGYRVEDIIDRLTQHVRYLDKLVDELARGRVLEKIMRQ